MHLSRILLASFAVSWLVAGSVAAYPRYNGTPACDDCHPGFVGRGSLHAVHQGSSRMTNTCNLCHVSTGDNPSTYSSGAVGGQGCRGCHGIDNGTVYGWGAGLRAHHANAGAPADADGLYCVDCHDSDPAPGPENALPPYYSRSDVRVTDPCVIASASGGEDWTGDGVGLDNDGDLDYEDADSDCGTSPVEGVTWGRIKAIYR